MTVLWHSPALSTPHGTLSPDLFLVRNGALCGEIPNFPNAAIAWGDQPHGTKVAIVSNGSAQPISGVDALVTREKNLALIIKTADCLPIFFVDPATEIIAIAHAGWRGLAAGIAEKTIEKMISLGAKPESIVSAIGPAIQKCHFEMPDPTPFSPFPEAIEIRNGMPFIDLFSVAMARLRAAGVKTIDAQSAPCTVCDARFPSFRRNRTETRLWNFILLAS